MDNNIQFTRIPPYDWVHQSGSAPAWLPWPYHDIICIAPHLNSKTSTKIGSNLNLNFWLEVGTALALITLTLHTLQQKGPTCTTTQQTYRNTWCSMLNHRLNATCEKLAWPTDSRITRNGQIELKKAKTWLTSAHHTSESGSRKSNFLSPIP